MVRHNRLLQISLMALVGAFLIFSAASAASAAGKSKKSKKDRVYRVTITNVTKGQIFSPPLLATHRAGFPVFAVGTPASTELAEDGSNAALKVAYSRVLPPTSSTRLRTWLRVLPVPSCPVHRRSTRFQDVVQDFQLSAQERGVKLHASVSERVPFVRADIRLIERVLQNLIENALRYTPERRRRGCQLCAAKKAACGWRSAIAAAASPPTSCRISSSGFIACRKKAARRRPGAASDSPSRRGSSSSTRV